MPALITHSTAFSLNCLHTTNSQRRCYGRLWGRVGRIMSLFASFMGIPPSALEGEPPLPNSHRIVLGLQSKLALTSEVSLVGAGKDLAHKVCQFVFGASSNASRRGAARESSTCAVIVNESGELVSHLYARQVHQTTSRYRSRGIVSHVQAQAKRLVAWIAGNADTQPAKFVWSNTTMDDTCVWISGSAACSIASGTKKKRQTATMLGLQQTLMVCVIYLFG